MAHAAGEHVGHGLEAAMRVVGKSGDVIGGVVRAKLVEHQEGIDVGKLRRADEAVELHAGAVARRHAFDEPRHRTGTGQGAIHGHSPRSIISTARHM